MSGWLIIDTEKAAKPKRRNRSVMGPEGNPPPPPNYFCTQIADKTLWNYSAVGVLQGLAPLFDSGMALIHLYWLSKLVES